MPITLGVMSLDRLLNFAILENFRNRLLAKGQYFLELCPLVGF